MNSIKLLIVWVGISFGFGSDVNAIQILQNVINNSQFVNQSYTVDLNQTQKNKLDKSRKFDIFTQWLDTGIVQKKIRVITKEPKNMKGVSYWVHQTETGGKKRWMTLPLTGKLVDITDKPINRNEFDMSELELSIETIFTNNNEIIGDETIFGRNCVIIKSSPNKYSVHNPIKKLWIDEEFNIIRKAEFISKSGRTIKGMIIPKIIQINDYQFPKLIEIFDKKKKVQINLTISNFKLEAQNNSIFEPTNIKYD